MKDRIELFVLHTDMNRVGKFLVANGKQDDIKSRLGFNSKAGRIIDDIPIHDPHSKA